ncbi:MAG: HEAT repeat domain-containing protein, partial [Isosphaeraceae bacterium]
MDRSLPYRALLTVALVATSATVGRARAQDPPTATPPARLADGLRADDVDVRRSAATRLQDADPTAKREALPTLIDLLMTEKDGQVRLAVLETVRSLGPDAAPAVPALVHTLRTRYGGQSLEESHQDYRSALALAAIGEPAVESLRELLNERKESVKAEVVMALGRIGPAARSAIPDLTPILGDPSERLRKEASLALGRIGAAAALIEASTHQDATTRSAAVDGLGRLASPDDRVHAALRARSGDDEATVRAAAIQALTRLPQAEATMGATLGQGLRDSDERVRRVSVNGLVERPTLLREMAGELETLLTGENHEVARLAAFLLGKAGAESAPRLLDALRIETSEVEPIAEALASLGRPVRDSLTLALDAPEPRVRRGAALALGRIRPLDPGVVETLTNGLDDPDREVRGAHLSALGSIGPRAVAAVPAIRALLRDESAEVRVQTVEI